MDFPLLACGWAVTRGNRVPFCLPPHHAPSALSSIFPSPSELLHCEDFLDREGHSCVIVMQQGSAAWDDVNETAFSNEKLLWHVLKDKAPTVWRVCLRFSTFLSPCCFGILSLTRAVFFSTNWCCCSGMQQATTFFILAFHLLCQLCSERPHTRPLCINSSLSFWLKVILSEKSSACISFLDYQYTSVCSTNPLLILCCLIPRHVQEIHPGTGKLLNIFVPSNWSLLFSFTVTDLENTHPEVFKICKWWHFPCKQLTLYGLN